MSILYAMTCFFSFQSHFTSFLLVLFHGPFCLFSTNYQVNAIPKEVWYLSGLKHLSINSNSRHHAQLATDTATTSPLMSPLKRPRLRSVPLQQLGTASNNTQQLTIMSSSARVTSRNVEDSHDDLCDATENGAAKSTERCHGSDNGRKSNSRGGKHRGDSTAAEDEDAEWAVWEQNWSKVSTLELSTQFFL